MSDLSAIIAAHMPSDIEFCEERETHEWHCMCGELGTRDRETYAAHVAAAIREANADSNPDLTYATLINRLDGHIDVEGETILIHYLDRFFDAAYHTGARIERERTQRK